MTSSVVSSSMLVLGLTLAVVMTSGARDHFGRSQAPAVAPVRPGSAPVPSVQVGWATFYADAFEGRPMADGRQFDLHDPHIAASNRWPLGTHLRVQRTAGGPWQGTLSRAELESYLNNSVEVTVEDRGDFSQALDLSAAAFAELGRPDEGIIPVSIEPLSVPVPPTGA